MDQPDFLGDNTIKPNFLSQIFQP